MTRDFWRPCSRARADETLSSNAFSLFIKWRSNKKFLRPAWTTILLYCNPSFGITSCRKFIKSRDSGPETLNKGILVHITIWTLLIYNSRLKICREIAFIKMQDSVARENENGIWHPCWSTIGHHASSMNLHLQTTERLDGSTSMATAYI
jgi:hypothetical protein